MHCIRTTRHSPLITSIHVQLNMQHVLIVIECWQTVSDCSMTTDPSSRELSWDNYTVNVKYIKSWWCYSLLTLYEFAHRWILISNCTFSAYITRILVVISMNYRVRGVGNRYARDVVRPSPCTLKCVPGNTNTLKSRANLTLTRTDVTVTSCNAHRAFNNKYVQCTMYDYKVRFDIQIYL